ncbi:MAG: family 16 glycoside hydrolase, partial [Flavitalea sp.]
MRRNNMLLLFVLLTTSVFAQSVGWVSLFDGKTLNGWRQLNGKATYEIANGTITGTTVTGEPNSFLATDKEYGDFIMEVECKVGNMNSG